MPVPSFSGGTARWQKHVELLKKGIGASRTGAGLAVVTMTTSEDKQKALQVDMAFLQGPNPNNTLPFIL